MGLRFTMTAKLLMDENLSLCLFLHKDFLFFTIKYNSKYHQLRGDIMSNITIGIVYRKMSRSLKIETIGTIVSELFDHKHPIECRYKADENDEQWTSVMLISEELSYETLEELNACEHVELSLTTHRIVNCSDRIKLRIENSENVTGILIDFSECCVHVDDYDEFENRTINYLESIYKKTGFDYAFCENEGGVILPVEEVLYSFDELYSILIIPGGKNAKILKSSWLLDGITQRVS